LFDEGDVQRFSGVGLSPPDSQESKRYSISQEDSQPTKKLPEVRKNKIENLAKIEDPEPLSQKRTPWTNEEMRWLVAGVTSYGVGHWRDILLCYDFPHYRTTVHLKDKWRNLLRRQDLLKKLGITDKTGLKEEEKEKVKENQTGIKKRKKINLPHRGGKK